MIQFKLCCNACKSLSVCVSFCFFCVFCTSQCQVTYQVIRGKATMCEACSWNSLHGLITPVHGVQVWVWCHGVWNEPYYVCLSRWKVRDVFLCSLCMYVRCRLLTGSSLYGQCPIQGHMTLLHDPGHYHSLYLQLAMCAHVTTVYGSVVWSCQLLEMV